MGYVSVCMSLFLGQTDEVADQQRTGDNQQSTERTPSQGKGKFITHRFVLKLFEFNSINSISDPYS